MKHLKKPTLRAKDIVLACAQSYRAETRNGIRSKLINAADLIQDESQRYDEALSEKNMSHFEPHETVNGTISADDMCDVYDNKLVKVSAIRNKYYDKLLATATTGKCPICGIGHVSNLDHYLAKTIYPIYAVTPYNLTPICRECNFEKLDSDIEQDRAPLHPYYDDVDSIEWLEAKLTIVNGSIAAEYSVSPLIAQIDFDLFRRLTLHMKMYGLKEAYSVQASTEISENSYLWKRKIREWGEEEFRQYLQECLVSREQSQRNTWNTALLRALIGNIEIVYSL